MSSQKQLVSMSSQRLLSTGRCVWDSTPDPYGANVIADLGLSSPFFTAKVRLSQLYIEETMLSKHHCGCFCKVKTGSERCSVSAQYVAGMS